ncbi:Ornithine decarboxylase antizyme 1 [Desmophyllum pertusum]|uniref:Ornithine decarboxylase antizyme n=1 Tax=Desmophyllum pertusum TaxID=174260 RepID=A0A9W9Y8U2_9CNID|nr:Ornithine decarboxylase antizyme 1 [Desmophyllum pertusum]
MRQLASIVEFWTHIPEGTCTHTDVHFRETGMKIGSQRCIVTIRCDSGWTGIPDVRYEEAGTASRDGGGGGDDDEDGISFLKLFSKDDEQYSFRFKSGERDIAECRAVLQNGQLYVEVPAGEIPPGGKECFISLLEYAEEHLDCTYVIFGLLKDRQDRESLMGTFKLMGFETVTPGHALCPNNPDYIFMAYTCTMR